MWWSAASNDSSWRSLVVVGGGGGCLGDWIRVWGRRGEKNVCFTLLDIFVAYKTCPGEIFLAWASWPNSDSPGRVLGEFLLQHISLLLCKGHSSSSRCYFLILNSQNLKTWVLSLQSKFEGDLTVNESEIMVLPK